MALLPEISYAPNPAEPIADVYAKLNDAINAINTILGGGLAGQSIRKIDGADFNFQFFTPYALPPQGGQAGKFLATNGTSEAWSFGTKGLVLFDSITPGGGGTITVNANQILYTIVGGLLHISFTIFYTVTSGSITSFTCVVPVALRPTQDDYWGVSLVNSNSATNYYIRTLVGSNGFIITAPDGAVLSGGTATINGSITYPIF